MPQHQKPILHWSDVLARNVRRLREELGLRQSEIADRARLLGVPLTQPAVAAIESGRRAVATGELMAFSGALQAPMSELLAGGGGYVELSPEDEPHELNAVQQRLTEDEPVVPSSYFTLKRLSAAYAEHDEAEAHAARVLGRERNVVHKASLDLWQRVLGSERDARLSGQDRAEASLLRARRGHITRQLLDELRSYLAEKENR